MAVWNTSLALDAASRKTAKNLSWKMHLKKNVKYFSCSKNYHSMMYIFCERNYIFIHQAILVKKHRTIEGFITYSNG